LVFDLNGHRVLAVDPLEGLGLQRAPNFGKMRFSIIFPKHCGQEEGLRESSSTVAEAEVLF
jgi:hypothetical protein